MELTVLAVPQCPTAEVLRERLTEALEGRADVPVTWHVVTDEAEAEWLGMCGSPTLLVDGVDPFARTGASASISCRLYGPEQGTEEGAPSVARLRAILAEPDHG